jgi:hypothetical protein
MPAAPGGRPPAVSRRGLLRGATAAGTAAALAYAKPTLLALGAPVVAAGSGPPSGPTDGTTDPIAGAPGTPPGITPPQGGSQGERRWGKRRKGRRS